MKNKTEKGITLVALVVTIVVLLIIAGVNISLVLDKNGVIGKSKKAGNQYAGTEKNEEKHLEETADWIEEAVTGNKKMDEVVIPEGYYYVGGTITTGIVISDSKEDNEKYKDAPNVGKDLDGNQWVWVPVEEPNGLYTTISQGVSLSGNTGVKTTKYTNSDIISGLKRGLPGETKGYKEPDLRIDYDTDERVKKAGFTSVVNMAETITNEYDEMTRSIEKYKGFYIGRYELSENGEKTGKSQTNKTWYELYKNCTTLATGTKAKTCMIWGIQWDVTCNWLAKYGFDIADSSAWGNYLDNTTNGKGELQNTGYSESWKANNIYDFAGNCFEWTQETYLTSVKASRGGYYLNNGSEYSASNRYYLPTYALSYYGTRPTLYIIP